MASRDPPTPGPGWGDISPGIDPAVTAPDEGYGYYWFRHHKDASTFIACRDEDDGLWYMCAIGHPIADIEQYATLLGRVPRTVVGGGSIDL